MKMTWMRWAGAALVALGLIGLAVGGFNYTKQTHRADVGPLEFSVKETDRFEIPVWADVLAIAAGAGLLWIGGRPRPR